MRKSLHRTVAVAFVCTTTVLSSACSSTEKPAAVRQADAVVVHEQWVKAVDSGMTAAFAELENSSDAPVRVVGASTPASSRMELHEIVSGDSGSMVMRPKEGGFVIPAGASHVLSPGGDHLMLMDVTAPLTPGLSTEFTLEFEDHSTATFAAQVRDFAGAQENYEPGGGDSHAAHDAPSAPAHSG
ncbi:copper chaperone PCu(A)C [Nocardia callitridis]